MKYYLLRLLILGLFFVVTSTNGLMERDSDIKILGEKPCGDAKCDLVTADSFSIGSYSTKSCICSACNATCNDDKTVTFSCICKV
ncbi:hypothetical protein F8M41_004957 [Gigaspora margarita]|uniref:Uncharacterized protein n=1 Tax=Gigaspora margarita TaxID=4874 RepID=A0A8H4AXI0_GIGMA|nr:hypothetical protein F8M41_004957 [Gigaspora margarita]